MDPNPAWNGYSSAKWKGDTQVVETIGFRDGLWLDTGGSPLTDAKPWTIHVTQIFAPDTELLDYICLENERDLQHLPKQIQ